MNIDFDKELLAFNEVPLSPDGPVSLKTICVNALLYVDGKGDPRRSPEVIPGEEMIRRYDLAERIYRGGNIDVTPEEVVLIKSQVAKSYPTVTVGPAYKLLNGS